MENEALNCIVTVELGEKFTLSGVTEVEGFTPSQVVLKVGRDKIVLVGENFKVLGYSEGSGVFSGSGSVHSFKRTKAGGSLRSRLLR